MGRGHVSVLALFAGLTLAWIGTALLISPAAVRLVGDRANLPMAFVGQALLWVIAAAVVTIVVFWERRPLASLWLKPFRCTDAIGLVIAPMFSEWWREPRAL